MQTPNHDFSRLIETERPRINEREGTILLPVGKQNLNLPPELIVLDGLEFTQKPELHITLIGRKVGQLLIHAANGAGSVFDGISRLIADTSWSIQRSGKFTQLHKVKPIEGSSGTIDARSIVELVDIPGSSEFFLRLSKIVGSEIVPPPFHMTIYTSADPEGIGVSSEADLNLYREKDIRRLG